MNLIVSSSGERVVNAELVKSFYVKSFTPLCVDNMNRILSDTENIEYRVYADKETLSSHGSVEQAKSALKKLCTNLDSIGGLYQMEDTK